MAAARSNNGKGVKIGALEAAVREINTKAKVYAQTLYRINNHVAQLESHEKHERKQAANNAETKRE